MPDNEEWLKLADAVDALAMGDPAARKLAIENPERALAEVGGEEIPAGLRLKVLAHDPPYDQPEEAAQARRRRKDDQDIERILNAWPQRNET